MTGLISIIIPVYNIDTKLSRCLDSILRQTIHEFELILVNDGSSDGSGFVCDDYAKKDSRIRVIHKPNGGVSSARNKGLSEASGEFIVFIDGDDYVSEDYLEKLQLEDEDLSIGSVSFADAEGNPTYMARSEYGRIEKVSVDNIVRWFDNGSLYSVWTSMFRSSIIEKYNLKFDETTTRGEDTIFMFEYVEKCQKVRFTEAIVYYYVKYGEGESSSSSITPQNILALDYLDKYLNNWFYKHGVKSLVFNDYYFWTRNELRLYLYEVMRNGNLSETEKYAYFKLFFSLSIFSDINKLFSRSKPYVRVALKLKSPTVLVLCSRIIAGFSR